MNQRRTLVVTSLIMVILGIGIVIPYVNAIHPVGSDKVIESLIPGANTIAIRDISNTNPQENATATIDTSSVKAGFITITIEDPDANLDTEGIDLILSSATSTSSGSFKATTQLEETGENTGTFSGVLILSSSTTTGDKIELRRGDDITILYEPEPFGVSRMSAELGGVSGSGDLILSDFIIDSTDKGFANFCPYDVITHPVDVKLPQGVTASSIDVTLSYANAQLGSTLPDIGKYEVVYRQGSTFQYESLTRDPITNAIPPANDRVFVDIDPFAKTISNREQPPSGTVEGQYALAINLGGCIGGGGGGLVRTGLVVNALAGAGSLGALFSGGSGDGPTAPTFGEATFSVMGNTSGEEGFGGIIADPATLDSTQTVEVGEDVVLRFDLYENQGINNIETITLYFNFAGENYDKSFIDTYIRYDRGEVTIVDPNGKFATADIEILQKDGWNLVVKATLNFANTMDTSNILIESVDLDRNFGKQLFVDAIEVVQPSITLADSENKFIIEPQDSSLIEIKSEPASDYIPIWVKSNAMWWQQKQIDDSDFAAGIKYLINQAIIEIPQSEASDSVSIHEIPQWLRNLAGFWADDSITDEEFVKAMQWLIENKIIIVQG